MSAHILILLNERSRTDFLDELQQLIHSFSNHSLLLYFTPSSPDIEIGIPFPFRHFPGNYAGKIPLLNAGIPKNEYNITLLLNLSGQEILDDQWRNIPEIKSDFFSQLYMQYCPAIIHGIIQQHNRCTFSVTLKDENNALFLLTKGTFKLLDYDYKKALELIFNGNIQLLADGIKRYFKNQKENLVDKESVIESLHSQKFHLLKRRLNQNKFKHRYRQLFYHDTWNIGIIDSPIEEVALQKDKIWEVKWLEEEKGNDFNADPFGCEIEGNHILLFENYINGKGKISSKKNAEEIKLQLELPIHLSYPYTLFFEGRWYCLPEQSASNKLEIFQVHPTTYQLENPVEILSHFKAVDPSLILKDEKWYLFCTDASDKGADVRLHIFIADSIFGPYRPHQKNPVKTNISSARCGGKIFTHDGLFYRPSQDSSRTYGGEIVIQRIDLLTEENFSETEINRIQPSHLQGKYGKGCHTLSSLGNRTLVDGKRDIFSFRNFFQKFRKKQNA
ncbi:MAG: hypothetical protein IPO63_05675 [Bacteroidetes bacterium]|nr:hypothetical protein [Bacteroidota bacterium]